MITCDDLFPLLDKYNAMFNKNLAIPITCQDFEKLAKMLDNAFETGKPINEKDWFDYKDGLIY